MRRVKLYEDGEGISTLVGEWVCTDTDRIDIPVGFKLQHPRWESEQIEPAAPAAVSEIPDIAPVPAEPDTVPQWFLDWRMSQYRADVCELADAVAGMKVTIRAQAEVMRTDLSAFLTKLNDYKLTNKAKLRMKEDERYDREYRD